MINEPRCRQKRQAQGLPYPKSGCDICGSVLREGWRCAEEVSSVTLTEAPTKRMTSERFEEIKILARTLTYTPTRTVAEELIAEVERLRGASA